MNIRDIASLAGVSASTVSKVMNGKDKDISEDTKKKVLKVIEEENYVPYFKFLEKEGIKNQLLGLLLRKDNREREHIVLAAERAAREQGYGVVVGYVENEKELETLAEHMIKKKVAGLLIDSTKWIVGGKYEDVTVYLNETKEFDDHLKAVLYYRLSEAARLATERLLEAGHQKIACIAHEQDTSIIGGYKLAMQNSNQNGQTAWAYAGQSLADIEKYGISQVLSENVTAIVCGSPEIVCCVLKAAERSRTAVPNELSVISIGDNRILEFIGCGITAVKLPSDKMTETAVSYLIEMIQGERRIEMVKRLQSAVTERGSIVEPPQEKQGEAIVVVGSMNMDVTIEGAQIPVAGETRLADKVYIYPGGKGANQAVGVGKLGGQVYMIGCLGNDMDGKQMYAGLVENHVHMDGVLFDPVLPSGKAYINIDEQGESAIVVYLGANRNVSVNQINRCRYLFEKAKYCLLSLEIPEAIAEYTMKFCKRNETEIILKPSGVEQIKPKLLAGTDYFVPNEKELHTFVKGAESLEDKAEKLLQMGVKHVIVTLGARGCYLRNREHSLYFEGTGFEAVDTTGGADSFISAMAVYLSEGKDLLYAIEFAIYASGLSVTRPGVQPALPERKAVDIYEDEIYAKYEEKRRKRR
ncbi:MAG: substrate-binding domain-containing protein [Lachnospiraceae bacterium]|mgnify:CR=1 FL=1|nr:substrate-binding domain-containing protein [Lachnospiraceae bacterium]